MIGWREWVALPGLGVPGIKAKIDTGARTSALHAFDVETYHRHGERWVRFAVHPLQSRARPEILCHARVADERLVMDSGGHRERRIVIATELQIGDRRYPIELSLADRDPLRFRMLLGRTALADGVVIDPRASYLTGRELRRAYRIRARRTPR